MRARCHCCDDSRRVTCNNATCAPGTLSNRAGRAFQSSFGNVKDVYVYAVPPHSLGRLLLHCRRMLRMPCFAALGSNFGLCRCFAAQLLAIMRQCHFYRVTVTVTTGPGGAGAGRALPRPARCSQPRYGPHPTHTNTPYSLERPRADA